MERVNAYEMKDGEQNFVSVVREECVRVRAVETKKRIVNERAWQ
jgi:hypothetical protein